MADVFLSYKKEDRDRVAIVVAGLESAGFSVWWDERLTPHGEWDETIAREIEDARAVAVLWTPASVESKWVRTEAHYANEREKLVPILLDDCQLPIAFLLNQTADLSRWDGDGDDPRWRKVLEWTEELVSAVPTGGLGKGVPESASGAWRNTFGETSSGEVIFDGGTISRRTAGGTFFRDSVDGPLMCVLPKGSFPMGAASDDPDRRDSELPRHVVEFNSPFAIGVYPVTFQEWDELGRSGGIDHAPPDEGWGRGTRPVIHVSWLDATAYATALGAALGAPYRLPSEAEWEYACRAGSTGSYAFEDGMDGGKARYRSGGGEAGTVEVGSYPANRFGLHDFHGNVREWVQDLWHDDYIGSPSDGLPWTSGHGSMRVVRGGSWLDAEWFLRAAARGRGGE
ncbi:MAG TPA: SUMF1/EgtB/PvdO family nonheme iron enzyme, partial [Longimicrobiales bacterium]|nr:SUMF1/EgtB/PvdO family nonheme iron enzyme [Longimicrobiales bacterium]